jgi:hypothetical protein
MESCVMGKVVVLILLVFSHYFYVSSFSFHECPLVHGNQNGMHVDWLRRSCRDGVLGKERKNKIIFSVMHAYIIFSFSVVDLHRFVENESSWETVKGVMKKYFPHSSSELPSS